MEETGRVEEREQVGSCCILFPHICKHPGEEHQLGAWNQRFRVPDLALLARFYNVDNSELSQSHYQEAQCWARRQSVDHGDN